MASYQWLHRSGELRERVRAALSQLANCTLCPRRCQVNRLAGEVGKCRTGRWAVVSSYGPHFGEEDPLVGVGGSGTIFFTHCSLRCLFCQNYSLSQLREGVEASPTQLAGMMLSLQARGCHNINLVSPSHVVAQILEALEIAASQGLSLPLVYNTGGYDSVETLRLLEGIVNIYMPDMKYADEETAARYSDIRRYPQVNRAAVKEMHRQMGDLVIDEQGVAIRGLLVRHLVLPQGRAGTAATMEFLAKAISPHTYVNVMAQYHPAYKAFDYPELSRRITQEEFREAIRMAREPGLERLAGEPAPLVRQLLRQ